MMTPIDHFDIKLITDFLGQPFWGGIGTLSAIGMTLWSQRKSKRTPSHRQTALQKKNTFNSVHFN